MYEMYNPKIKEEFLSQYKNENTRLIAMYALRKTASTERRLQKDLYEMSLSEIEDILYELSSSSVNALALNVSKIEEYILWASENGYRRSNITPLPTGNREKWIRKFIAQYRNYAFSKNEIESMKNQLVNEVDKALLLLIFEGVRGKGWSEIINLKREDVVEAGDGYNITLRSEDRVREIHVSRELGRLLILADGQREYRNRNGSSIGSPQEHSVFIKTDFIFKRTTRGSQYRKTIDSFYVSRKIGLFKETFQMPFLKARHIYDSGIMSKAYECQVKHGVLRNEQLGEIAQRYGLTQITDGQAYQRISRVKEIIKRDDYKELYGIEAKFEN